MRQRFPLKPLCLVVLQALACQAYAGDTATDAAADDSAIAALAGPIQSVEITGRGQSRQVQNINKTDLAEALPGTSPLKVLEKLPGVNFQSADPFGAYEWSTRFSIRGFNQNSRGARRRRRARGRGRSREAAVGGVGVEVGGRLHGPRG